MSMESLKKIIADNPGILQCELDKIVGYKFSGTQLTKLVRRNEITRIEVPRRRARSSYRLYVVGAVIPRA